MPKAPVNNYNPRTSSRFAGGKLLDKRNFIRQLKVPKFITEAQSLQPNTKGLFPVYGATHALYKYKNFLYDPNDSTTHGFVDPRYEHYERPLWNRIQPFNACSDKGACYLIASAIKSYIERQLRLGTKIEDINNDLLMFTTDDLINA